MEKIDKCSILCDEELVMMHQINFPLTKIYTAYDEHYLELFCNAPLTHDPVVYSYQYGIM